jgi:glycosyltransferase involved in cell wall biosynthesis
VELWPQLRIGRASLSLVGPFADRELESALRERASRREDVTITGPLSRGQLRSFLQVVDIGLLLSVEEGYGLVTLEYMRHGVPFVMTDVGASIEFSRDNPDCIIVPIDPSAIGRGIEEMAGRVRSGLTSRQRLAAFTRSRFAFEDVADAHLDHVLHGSVLRKDRPR